MESIKQNLCYIKRSLMNGTNKEQGAIIHLMLVETIEAVKETTFRYEVQYSSENYLKHNYTFITRSRMYKYKLLADLEELQCELSKRNTNVQRFLILLNKLLQNNLYQVQVNGVINKWTNTTAFKTKTKTLHVK